MSTLVVGSRGSALALHQTQLVVRELERANPGIACRIEIIKTTGDKITDVPLAKIGEKGLFVKEIELALLRREIDLAVHSCKDMQSEMDEDLCIGAFPEREDPSDALVSAAGKLAELPAGAMIGTSSIRRRAQLLAARPDLEITDLRGNLDTRLKKVGTPGYNAVILAAAGLRRMGWESRITETLPFDVCMPAVGQGALAVQCHRDSAALDAVARLDHAPTRRCVTAERALLARMGAGCQTPIAALAREIDGSLVLDAVVTSPDGSKTVRRSGLGEPESAEEIGRRVAELLLDSPAAELLEEVRRSAESGPMGAA